MFIRLLLSFFFLYKILMRKRGKISKKEKKMLTSKGENKRKFMHQNTEGM